MAVCAIQGQAGVELVPMQPAGQCAGLVLLEPSDVPPNPLALSAADGALVAAAVASCWMAAFAMRSVISVVRGPRDE